MIALYQTWLIALTDRLRIAKRGVQRVVTLRESIDGAPVRLEVRTGDEDVRVINEMWLEHVYRTEDILEGHAPVVVDIGANKGYFAVHILSLRPAATLVCVEPHPDNVAALRRNLELNGFPGIDIEQVAVTPDSQESIDLYLAPLPRNHTTVQSMGRERISVRARGLGEQLSRLISEHGRIDLLKVDTEGTEAALLCSLSPEVLGSIGAIAAEVGYRLEDSRAVESHLETGLFDVEVRPPFLWAKRTQRYTSPSDRRLEAGLHDL